MKTGPAIADILKKEGVEYLFAYPVNHLIEACAAHARAHDAKRLAWQTAKDNHRAQAVYDRIHAGEAA